MLVETMKQLPYNLHDLVLNLRENNIGKNSENLKMLAGGMNQLPNNLKNLKLDLTSNNLDTEDKKKLEGNL